MKKTSIGLFAACALSLALAGCSSPNADWNKASTQNTVAAYQGFIHSHPDDARVQQARNRIDALQDTQAWDAAKSAGTIEAYQQYLQQYPNGSHAADAQSGINSLKQSAAWAAAQSAGTVAAYQGFLQNYPNATQAGQAQAQIDKLAGYQALLGSFKSQSAAQSAATALKSKFSGVLADVVVVPPSGTSKLTEVRSAQMSQSDAQAACAKVRKAHQSCSVVKIQAAAASGVSSLSTL